MVDADSIINKVSDILASSESIPESLQSNVLECFATARRIYSSVPRNDSAFDECVFDKTCVIWNAVQEQLLKALSMHDSSVVQHNLLEAEPGLVSAFKLILNYLNRFNLASCDGPTVEDDQEETALNLDMVFRKALGSTLFSTAVDKAVLEEYELAKSLLLVVACCFHFKWRLKLPAKAWSFIERDCIPRLSELLRFYAMVHWICTKPVEPLALRYHFSPGLTSARKEKFLLDHFIGHRTAAKLRNFWKRHWKGEGVDPMRQPAISNVLAKSTVEAFRLSSIIVSLFEFLVSTEQYNCLLEFCELLELHRDDLRFCRLFVQGFALLHLDYPQQALEKFRIAYEGVERRDSLLIEQLSMRVDDDLTVDYFRKVAEMFEKRGMSKCVIELCQYCMDVTPEDPCIMAILTMMFKHYSILEQYDDAFSIIRRMHVDSNTQKACLREFIFRLQDKNMIGKLHEYEFGELETEIFNIIESRARSVDIAIENYYEFLYAFSVSRSNYRKATSYLYEMAARFYKEIGGIIALRTQVYALSTCLHTLSLEREQWIDGPVLITETSNLEIAGSSPKRSSDGMEKQAGSVINLRRIHANEIQREYILAKCCLAVSEQKGIYVGVLSTQELLKSLIQFNLFDLAVDLSVVHELPVTEIIDNLTVRCVQSDKPQALTSVEQDRWALLSENNAICSEVTDSRLQSYAWSMLRAYLQQLSKISPPSPLYATAVRRLLSLSHTLPQWLLVQFKQIDFPELLRILIEYDHLAEAQRLLCHYIDAVLGVGPEDFNLQETLTVGKRYPVWLPVSSIDLLLVLLSEKRDAGFEKLRNELEEKIKVYFNHLNVQMEIARKK